MQIMEKHDDMRDAKSLKQLEQGEEKYDGNSKINSFYKHKLNITMSSID